MKWSIGRPILLKLQRSIDYIVAIVAVWIAFNWNINMIVDLPARMILLGELSGEPKSRISPTSLVCGRTVLFSLITSMAYLKASSSLTSDECFKNPARVALQLLVMGQKAVS